MKVYNTQSRRKEEFVPREAGKVAMYVCGPTAYNDIHLGNARTFLSFDVMRRYLTYKGFKVTFVQNITDIDDKIINKANEEGTDASEIARTYTQAFIDAMRKLGVRDPDIRPLATREIPAMISLIETLIDKGHAYESSGDVYFSVRSFPAYGSLSGRNIDEMLSGARVEIDERKRDPLDFALWKAAKEGEPSWDSPWGPGRPGWHIECSAMSQEYLGLPLDIHGGGTDLSFPHHENEAAQSEAAWGDKLANYWLHGGMLRINSEKMSKSLGNFTLLKDVLETHDPNVVRLLMLQTHYRSPLDFSDDRLKEAESSLERIATSVKNITWATEKGTGEGAGGSAAEQTTLEEGIAKARETFIAEMDDDFNTAGALAAVFTLVSQVNSYLAAREAATPPGLSQRDSALLRQARTQVIELLDVLGLSLSLNEDETWPEAVIDLANEITGYAGGDTAEAVNALLDARDAARTEKRWDVADAVRDGLAGLGFTVEDTPSGARVSYKGA